MAVASDVLFSLLSVRSSTDKTRSFYVNVFPAILLDRNSL